MNARFLAARFLVVTTSAVLLLGSTSIEARVARAGSNVARSNAAQSKAAQSQAPATNWKQVPIPPLPPFKPKEPTRIVLPNGMVIFLTENHELPLLSGRAMVRGGSDSEPAEKTGLVELYGATWRTGGTEKLSGDQLDDQLEARAAKVETGASGESTLISFNCLKADFPEVFASFVDLLRNPAFREDKLSLAKKSMYSEISRRNDESSDIAHIQTEVLGYGKQSAYARIPEYATVAAVTRDDLLQWHKQHTTPSNIIFGVVGDFNSKEMEATLRKAFEQWPAGEKVEMPKVPIEPAKPGIYLVDKNDVNQSEVRMVGLGIERRNPDYFALQVLNEVFGGGFSSRLFMNLRTKAGLAYSVGGGVGSGWDHPGLTVVAIGTKTETTVEAIKGLWEQIDSMKKEPPTEAEVKRGKDAILNSFIFQLDTPSKVLNQQMTYEFYGYPRDFLEKYRAGVEKVTPADVTRVANQYLHKEELKVLVIGNAAEFQKQLAELGPVSPLDVTIPPPPPQQAENGLLEDHAEDTSELRHGAHLQTVAMSSDQSAGENATEPGTPQMEAPQTQEAAPTPSKPDLPGTQSAPAQAAPAAPATGQASGGNAEGKAAIAKFIEKAGGAEKLASIKILHLHLKATQGGVETRIDQNTVYPDKQVLIVTFDRGAIRQVLTPDAAFMQLAIMGPQDLPPAQRDLMAAALKCDFLNVLQHASDPKYNFTANGKENLEGIDATIVEINADGARTRWWIAPDGTLLQEERAVSSNPAASKYVTRYSSWKSFDGLSLPTRQEQFINGAEEGMTRIIDVEVNHPVDPKLFEK